MQIIQRKTLLGRSAWLAWLCMWRVRARPSCGGSSTCRAPTKEKATVTRTMWRCAPSIANCAAASRWRRPAGRRRGELKPMLLKGSGNVACRAWDVRSRTISTFPRFPQQKFFSVVLTACAWRVTRVVRERSDRPSLGKHGKRKLDELHGARKAGTASAKFGAVQRHGEALGLDQRWAGRAPVRQLMEGATQTTDLT
jgi:hypothetical protein